jgi:hypothetical protein
VGAPEAIDQAVGRTVGVQDGRGRTDQDGRGCIDHDAVGIGAQRAWCLGVIGAEALGWCPRRAQYAAIRSAPPAVVASSRLIRARRAALPPVCIPPACVPPACVPPACARA